MAAIFPSNQIMRIIPNLCIYSEGRIHLVHKGLKQIEFRKRKKPFNSLSARVKPVIGQSQPVVRNIRQEEVVLARLRIGHTRITHSYLLKREEPPYCFGCDTLFTVRHFLLECGDFSHIRNKYFHVDTIKQLFNDVPIDNVFLFLKEINLFNKL